MMTADNIIEVKNLSKKFNGKLAVDNISLNVKRGEIFGFLGPNGSGKTTTIRMLCGLMTPDSGTGNCLGYDIRKHSRELKRLVGYVPQIFSLYQDLTVQENLTFIARIYELANVVDAVNESMQSLQLDQYRDVLAARLSGGWKQRLSLAAALIHQPKLLLLDEPTAGVDPKARREFWNEITRLTAKGISSLVSTHYMDEAERCHRLAYMVNGKLMAQGSLTDIIAQAGLLTWAATGDRLSLLADEIRDQPGVTQVVAWGSELRVCGTDQSLLKQTIAQYPQYQWQAVPTSLEEVFIQLVGEAQTQ